MALTDLTQGRNPLDRIKPQPAAPSKSAPPGNDPAGAQADDVSGPAGDSSAGTCKPVSDPATDRGNHTGQVHPGEPTPLPALINLLVPAGTLLGWSTAPGEAAGWGLLDTEETRRLVEAASRHPRTRWCVTVAADGTAIAHGCATGQHPWPGKAPPSPGRPPHAGTRDAPAPAQAARLIDLLKRLKVTLEPIAKDTCDHRSAESRDIPSRE